MSRWLVHHRNLNRALKNPAECPLRFEERRRAVAYGSTRRSLTSGVPANDGLTNLFLKSASIVALSSEAGTGRPKKNPCA